MQQPLNAFLPRVPSGSVTLLWDDKLGNGFEQEGKIVCILWAALFVSHPVYDIMDKMRASG
ncbi:hypothetical protein INF35_04770 [Subdoligranulum sp. DSM 109015]|uniref:Uncharacterized protein n=1 Tax=Gemmiger gallinarum TaxID=2779354 RepID=A0ABR9R1S5_9FIRM|nr:hypothetical protein [Gemmiger gallinarum]